MIWLGWTSNCWASSASVFSPLTAARATFALKAGVWFRRGRLLIVTPALRPSWPRSGRKPPLIQPVQKSRASSELGEGHLGIGVGEHLLVDASDPLQGADVERVLRPAVARALA